MLHVNAEVGVTTSTDPLGVPISERYLVGGIYDIRGYAPRSLGPRLLTQTPGDVGQPLGSLPLGGNMQIIFNSEIEFPLFKKVGISGVVFYDMGNAYNLEDRYCSGLQRKNASIAIKFDPCFRLPGLADDRPPQVGRLRLPLVLADRPAAVRVGYPARRAARRGSAGVRVHDRQLLLEGRMKSISRAWLVSASV